ncbi:MAG: SAM-dependent DNA methyltransferase [Deltaproteobacteria bacterium]|nr:SAM-dependent DNA methyltransferase [Deltaproteobacteria bacterium]
MRRAEGDAAEALQAALDAAPSRRGRSRRHAEGAYFTPAPLAAELARRGLSPALHRSRPGADAPRSAWEAHREALSGLTVLDPACGAGALLVEAWRALKAAWDEAEEEIRRRGGAADPEGLRRLQHQALWGLDLNPDALALAQRALAELGATPQLRAQDALHPGLELPCVDVIVGNPPFGRLSRHPEAAALLRRHAAAHGQGDLSACFVERALGLLRPGGRLALILPNKWLRAPAGAPLRAFLHDAAWVETVIDLGHAPLFGTTDAFPCLLIARRPHTDEAPPTSAEVQRLHGQARLDALGALQTRPVARASLGAGPWGLGEDAVEALLCKMEREGQPLFTWGEPLYGVKTGLNRAFVLNEEESAALHRDCPASAGLLVPFARGEDLGRPPARQLLALRSSRERAWPWSGLPEVQARAVFERTYPGAWARLAPMEDALRARADQGAFWWELRRTGAWELLLGPKLLWPDLAWRPTFRLDPGGLLPGDTCFALPSADPWLIAALQHPLTWWWLWHRAQRGKDEVLRLKRALMRRLPIPKPHPDGAEAAWGLNEQERRLVARTAPPTRRALG